MEIAICTVLILVAMFFVCDHLDGMVRVVIKMLQDAKEDRETERENLATSIQVKPLKGKKK